MRAAPQTTNASSLAGGVKGNISWLLGDQSWLGKISGCKPAEGNHPASFHFFFLCLSHSHHVFLQLPFLLHGERKEVQCAVCGMIHWVNSSSLGAACEDMVVFECVTVASEGCRCLEGCCEEVLRGRVFHQGYGGFCDACVSATVHMQGKTRDGWGRMVLVM